MERVAKPTPALGVTTLQQSKPFLQKKNESGKGPSLGCTVMKQMAVKGDDEGLFHVSPSSLIPGHELLKQRPKGR